VLLDVAIRHWTVVNAPPYLSREREKKTYQVYLIGIPVFDFVIDN
jgi:hypothetical protein